MVKNLPAMQEPLVQFLGQEDPLEKGFLGFPGGSDSKESTCNAGDRGSIPRSGRSPEEENGYPLNILAREFLPQRSLVGYSLCGCKQLDTTKQLGTQ